MQGSIVPRSGWERALQVAREGIASREAHSVVMAVANHAETQFLDCLEPGDGERPRDDSIFLLASISKPFMGTTMMQLLAQGKLLLTDPVVRFIPEFGRYGKEGITLWHLLTHTSGLAEEVDGPPFGRRASAAEHLEATYNAFTHFKAGAAYEYCNISFAVMAEVLARVTGVPYPQYLCDHVLAPLGMADTGFDFQGPQAARMMPVHGATADQPFGDAPNHLAYFKSLQIPAGGLWSTAPDLVRFGQAMLNGLGGRKPSVLSCPAMQAMTALQTEGINELGSGVPARYALGWGKPGYMLGHLGSPEAFGHGGATATWLWIDPAYDLVFVFLTNLWGQPARVAVQAYNALMGTL
ncbi:MAG: serine hydrolase domain-containing protein [Anaerolineae bacterium]